MDAATNGCQPIGCQQMDASDGQQNGCQPKWHCHVFQNGLCHCYIGFANTVDARIAYFIKMDLPTKWMPTNGCQPLGCQQPPGCKDANKMDAGKQMGCQQMDANHFEDANTMDARMPSSKWMRRQMDANKLDCQTNPMSNIQLDANKWMFMGCSLIFKMVCLAISLIARQRGCHAPLDAKRKMPNAKVSHHIYGCQQMDANKWMPTKLDAKQMDAKIWMPTKWMPRQMDANKLNANQLDANKWMLNNGCQQNGCQHNGCQRNGCQQNWMPITWMPRIPTKCDA